MDEMIITGNNVTLIKLVKIMLAWKIDMKDLGLADVIVGIKITKISNGYTLSQSHYIEKILNYFLIREIRV